MLFLGISEGPGASAALVADGRLVAAAAQERLDRVRRSAAFPSAAIDAVLDHAGVRARDVHRVVLGGAPPPLDARGEEAEGGRPGPAPLATRARGWLATRSARPRVRDAVTATLRASGLHMVTAELVRRRIEPRLRAAGFEHAELTVYEEDRCQAWAAYRTQAANTALIVLLDEAVDGAAVSVSLARNGQVDRLLLQTSFAPLCGLPARLLARLGGGEGALDRVDRAAADRRLVAAIGEIAGFDRGMLRTRSPRRGMDPLDALAAGVPVDTYAASVLVALEEAVVAFAAHWMNRTGVRTLALTGTMFRMPGLVGRVLTEAHPTSLHVVPDPGAGAAAIGAALGAAGTPPVELASLGLGPAFSDDACYRALSVAELPRDKQADPERVAAETLAAGTPLARFAGALPVGEAPLGGRSVLFRADTRPPEALAERGEPWCLVREEDIAVWLPTLGAAGVAPARQGVLALPAGALGARCQGVVRSDGTVCPVVVRAGDPLHRLLTLQHARTGLPAVADVPLTPAAAPLPASPGDAVRAWRDSDVPALLLGSYRVTR